MESEKGTNPGESNVVNNRDIWSYDGSDICR